MNDLLNQSVKGVLANDPQKPCVSYKTQGVILEILLLGVKLLSGEGKFTKNVHVLSKKNAQ